MKAKPKAKKKPMKVSTERNKALHELQRYVVERASTASGFCRCVTCGTLTDNAQGGHYISRDCRATELLEDNVHPQCPICNCFGKGGGPGEQILHGRWIADNVSVDAKERLDNLFLAWKGNDDIYETLSPEDKVLARGKKTASYYHEKYLEYSRKRKELSHEK